MLGFIKIEEVGSGKSIKQKTKPTNKADLVSLNFYNIVKMDFQSPSDLWNGFLVSIRPTSIL